jgi:transposase-like protein
VSVSDLCDELGLHPNQFYQLPKQFFETASAAFKPDRPITRNARRRMKWSG